MVEFISAKEVVNKYIKDNTTICSVGMTLSCVCEEILKEIEDSFSDSGHPNNLTLFHSSGQCDRKTGIQRLAHEGLLKKIIGGHWGLCPGLMKLISENKILAYCIPQGQGAQLVRSIACGLPGKISKVGLGTFLDPRLEGGKMNEITKNAEDYIKIINFEDEEYLFYPSISFDAALIRGTTADEKGNITTEEEGVLMENLPAVLAARRFGGKVIVQVKRLVQYGTLNPKDVKIPGVYVDAVVLCSDPDNYHRQTSSWVYNPAYSGQTRIPLDSIPPYPLDVRKVIGRRAIMELKSNSIINLGTGIPNDVIGSIAYEEKISDLITITVESGIYGGVSAGGVDFGVAANADAIISHDAQFDYYDGVGVDYAFMGAGEMDEEGNVNATKFGDTSPGSGGFIDITSNAKNVIFCSTFTAKGLEVNFENNKLNIINEGILKKLVKKVQQVSFSGKIAREKGQNAYFITERAIFKIVKEGVLLVEIAKGIDLDKDVLSHMEFKPLIAEELKIINPYIYEKGLFRLRDYLINKK